MILEEWKSKLENIIRDASKHNFDISYKNGFYTFSKDKLISEGKGFARLNKFEIRLSENGNYCNPDMVFTKYYDSDEDNYVILRYEIDCYLETT